MPITVRSVGVTELIGRLSTLNLSSLLNQFVVTLGEDIADSVREKTPVVSGDLQGSIESTPYGEGTVVISTPLYNTYGTYIETGVRNDPRTFSAGMLKDKRGRFVGSDRRVFRAAGPAHMFLDTYNEFLTSSSARVGDLFNAIRAVWKG